MGGETCVVNAPRTDCETALAELEQLQFNWLNPLWHPDVVQGWSDQGCLSTITERLGHRFELTGAQVSEAVRPGGVLRVELQVTNTGWSAPFSPRWVQVTLTNGAEFHDVLLDEDPRTWRPGQTQQITASLRVPADAPPGA